MNTNTSFGFNNATNANDVNYINDINDKDNPDILFYLIIGVILLAIVLIIIANMYTNEDYVPIKYSNADMDDTNDYDNNAYDNNAYVKENINDDVRDKRYRRVYFSKTKFYFLTVNNKARKAHILDEFKEYSPIEINPVTGISRNMSGSTGFCRMVDKGLRDQDLNKPFQPFVMLEDDASKYRQFPEYIDIPMDADIVYLGLHSWGYSKDEPINIIYSEHVDKNLMRVKNLLALHAVMICSAAGGALMQRCMTESFYRDKPWDIPITLSQPFYHVYALKIPLVYQDKKYGGKENVTKITARKRWFKKMPEKHINRYTTSNIMGWNEKDKN